MTRKRKNQIEAPVAIRVGSRTRTPKQFLDYVDCSFSESEPARLIEIPSRKAACNESNSSRGNGNPKRSQKRVHFTSDAGETMRFQEPGRFILCHQDPLPEDLQMYDSYSPVTVAEADRYKVPETVISGSNPSLPASEESQTSLAGMLSDSISTIRECVIESIPPSVEDTSPSRSLQELAPFRPPSTVQTRLRNDQESIATQGTEEWSFGVHDSSSNTEESVNSEDMTQDLLSDNSEPIATHLGPGQTTSLQERAAPSTSLQERAAPSTNLQQRTGPSTSLQQRPVPSTSLQQRPIPWTSLQQRPVPSTSLQQRPVPSTSLEQRTGSSTTGQQRTVPSTSLQQRTGSSTTGQQRTVPLTSLQQRTGSSTTGQQRTVQSTSLHQRTVPSTSLQPRKGPPTSLQERSGQTSGLQPRAGPSISFQQRNRQSTSLQQRTGLLSSLQQSNSSTATQQDGANSQSRYRSSQATNGQWPPDIFQDYVKKSLEYLKVYAREMSSKIDLAIENGRKDCMCPFRETDDLENKFSLPLQTFEEIDGLEEQLQDVPTKQQLKLLLLRIGGRTTNSAVFNIMYRLFSIKMGASFTWTGRSAKGKRKRVFGTLNLVSVIRDTVDANEAIDKKDKKNPQIDFAIREWLRHCQEKLDDVENVEEGNEIEDQEEVNEEVNEEVFEEESWEN